MSDPLALDWALVEPGFSLPAAPRFLVVQPDWGTRLGHASNGERVCHADNKAAAIAFCVSVAERAIDEQVSFLVIPEFALPAEGVDRLISVLQQPGPDIVVMAGVEGMTIPDYHALLGRHQVAARHSGGGHINSLFVLVRSAGTVHLRSRVKKYVSSLERKLGLEPCCGTDPYLALLLGPRPITVVPLLCSELLAPDFYVSLEQQFQAGEVSAVDYFVVLQLNSDLARSYFPNAVRTAYSRGGAGVSTESSRFVFANHALSEHSDGQSLVLVGPHAASRPQFNLNHSVYWEDLQGCGGFRLPDGTGCTWQADVLAPGQATGPGGQPICGGGVVGLYDSALEERQSGGLAHGLLRVECRRQRQKIAGRNASSKTEVSDEMLLAASPGSERFVLTHINRDAASAAMHCMECDATGCPDTLSWENVERAAMECIEAVTLLSAGGALTVVHPDVLHHNCLVNKRPVLIMLGDSVETAVAHRFGDLRLLASPDGPVGVVLVCVVVETRRTSVRSILKADRVTGVTEGLHGVPNPNRDANACLPFDPHLCSLALLRQAGLAITRDEATNVLAEFLPGVIHVDS